MERFTQLRGVAAPFLRNAVDTDLIFPARFLLITERRGLGRYLFHDLRRDAQGRVTGEFVLDRPEFAAASILIAGPGFGCGSSREQAVWTLLDAGIRCVIAPSFGDIFYANAFQNGLLPLSLEADVVLRCAELAQRGLPFDIDLVRSELRVGDEPPIRFTVPQEEREALLQGWDSVDQVLLGAGEAIAEFEKAHRERQPWLW